MYLQVGLAFIHCVSLLATQASEGLQKLRQSLEKYDIGLLLIGASLLITAAVQLATSGLTLYHAFIILLMNLLIAITVTLPFNLRYMTRRASPNPNFWQHIKRSLPIFGIYTVYLCFVGGFGVWVFTHLERFEDDPSLCTTSTTFYFFGHYHLVVDSATPWLAIYIIACIPILNFLLLTAIFGIASFILAIPLHGAASQLSASWPNAQQLPRHLILVLPVLITATCCALIIVAIESTVKGNNVSGEESDWTFGQILAIIVVLFPLIDYLPYVDAPPSGNQTASSA